MTPVQRAVHAAVVAERERIARALHDAALQSVQALIMLFDQVKHDLPAGHPVQQKIDAALDLAQRLMNEGRDEVVNLRCVDGSPDSLGHYLAELGETVQAQYDIRFSLAVRGTARMLPPGTATEMRAIAREALLNAVIHSGSAALNVELAYTAGSVRMTVRDNGRGFDTSVHARAGLSGHWGLCGMCERARKIGGELQIDSNEGNGTTVCLEVFCSIDPG